MPSSIHGHDVLDLLDDPQTRYTRATFMEAIEARFGDGARFHTCSARELTAAGLLNLLEARGKFLESEGYLRRTPGASCGH